MNRSYSEIEPDLRPDGALRDFYIQGTTSKDWDKFLQFIRRQGFEMTFSLDGAVTNLPITYGEIERLRSSCSVLLRWSLDGAQLTCHFFHDAEIELSFRPSDFRSEERWQTLIEFLQKICDSIEKRGIVTYENELDAIIETIEPAKVVYLGG